MKITTSVKLEKFDYIVAEAVLKKAMDHEREMAIPLRSDLIHELVMAIEAVAEKAFKLGMESVE